MKFKIKTNKKQIIILKISKLFTLAALTIMLCFGTVLPIFAAGGEINASGTPQDPAVAVITKILKMPSGTTTPTTEFTFDFEPISVHSDKTESYTDDPVPNMPEIPSISVNFNANTQNEIDPLTGGKYLIADGIDNIKLGAGIKGVYQETDNILLESDGTTPIAWPKAGQYKYHLTEENAGTSEMIADSEKDDYTDEMTYSAALYEITVHVYNIDGDPDKGTYVAFVTVIRLFDDEGTEDESGDKIDPTPGTSGNNHDYSQLQFTNIYTKKTGKDDPTKSSDTVLEIGKKVMGDGSSVDKYFEFKINIINPMIGADPNAKYKAYVVEKVNSVDTVVTAAYNGSTSTGNGTLAAAGPDGHGNYIEFTPGETGKLDQTGQTVYLKHGQRLVFLDLQVGASFEVKEEGTGLYKASYITSLNGGNPSSGGTTSSINAIDFGVTLSIPSSQDPKVKYIGEKANSVAFTNTTSKIDVPTGISVDDLPYIVIIGLTLVSLAAFVTIIARKNAKGVK